MPECHSCKWDGLPFSPEKQEACLDCVQNANIDNLTNKGRTIVSTDAGMGPQSAASVRAAQEKYLKERSADPERTIDPADPAIKDAMILGALRLLQYLRDLETNDMLFLFNVMSNSLAGVARTTQGVEEKTRAWASKWWRDLVAAHPELDTVIFSNRNNPSLHARARIKEQEARKITHYGRQKTQGRTDSRGPSQVGGRPVGGGEEAWLF